MAQFDEMKQQLQESARIFEEKEQYRTLCQSMYEEGLITQAENGVFRPVDDPLERESIKSKIKQRNETNVQQAAASQQDDAFKNSKLLDEDDEGMQEMA